MRELKNHGVTVCVYILYRYITEMSATIFQNYMKCCILNITLIKIHGNIRIPKWSVSIKRISQSLQQKKVGFHYARFAKITRQRFWDATRKKNLWKDKVLNKYFGISVNVLTNHKNIWQPGTRSIWEVPRSEACSRPDLGRGNTLPILTPCSPEF